MRAVSIDQSGYYIGILYKLNMHLMAILHGVHIVYVQFYKSPRLATMGLWLRMQLHWHALMAYLAWTNDRNGSSFRFGTYKPRWVVKLITHVPTRSIDTSPCTVAVLLWPTWYAHEFLFIYLLLLVAHTIHFPLDFRFLSSQCLQD